MSLESIRDFTLERYFARWEFAVEYQLSSSDVEPFKLPELLELADDDARQRWESLSLGYTESAGLPALRQEIAREYPGLEADNIIVLAGAEEGIFLAMAASLRDGDHAVVVTPAYQSLHEIPRALGASVTQVPLLHDAGWQLNIEDVKRAVTRETSIIAVNFPHNPTGAHVSPDSLRQLAEIAADANAILLSDEVYRGLEYDAHSRLQPAAVVSQRAVSLGVMSKSYALAGIRIGWLAARDRKWLERVARLRDYTTICCSAPSELLALIALRARDRVLERSRGIVSANISHASAFIEQRSELLEWVAPRAGSVAFPLLRAGRASELSERLARDHATLLLPGDVFGELPSHFRLGLGRRDFPIALEKLAAALRGFPAVT